MKQKIVSNLSYLICAGLASLHFILLAFPYVASYYSYDLGAWGGEQSVSYGISGYKVMDLWDGGFGGVMSALTQLLILLFVLGMLGYGVYGVLKAWGIIRVTVIPEKFCSKAYATLAVYAYAALHVLLLIFLIILSASNSESALGGEAGIRLSAGIFITLVMAAGGVVAGKILPNLLGGAAAPAENETV